MHRSPAGHIFPGEHAAANAGIPPDDAGLESSLVRRARRQVASHDEVSAKSQLVPIARVAADDARQRARCHAW
jgi:hypothetical protein